MPECSWCKPPPEPQSEVNQTIQLYHDLLKDKTGVCFTPNGRHFKNVKDLLAHRSPTVVRAMIRFWFREYGAWADYGFVAFTSDPTRIEVAMTKEGRNGRTEGSVNPYAAHVERQRIEREARGPVVLDMQYIDSMESD